MGNYVELYTWHWWRRKNLGKIGFTSWMIWYTNEEFVFVKVENIFKHWSVYLVGIIDFPSFWLMALELMALFIGRMH